MKNKILIIGAGGHGKVAADIAIKMGCWHEIAFLDDKSTTSSPLGQPIIGKISDYYKFGEVCDFFVAIGDNAIREEIQTKLEEHHLSVVNLIHPESVIGLEVDIGVGSIIMAGTVINCSTRIGRGCIINTCSSVDHDCLIGDFCHISPGVRIAGNVKIEKKSWLGINSTVINNRTISQGSMIGAGAVVVDNIVEFGIYVGVPAKKRHQ